MTTSACWKRLGAAFRSEGLGSQETNSEGLVTIPHLLHNRNATSRGVQAIPQYFFLLDLGMYPQNEIIPNWLTNLHLSVVPGRQHRISFSEQFGGSTNLM